MVYKGIVASAFALLAGCGSSFISPSPAVDPGAQTEVLIKNLDSEDPITRMFAAGALGNLGEQAKQHVPAIKKLLTDREPNVRNAAKEAIQKIEKGG